MLAGRPWQSKRGGARGGAKVVVAPTSTDCVLGVQGMQDEGVGGKDLPSPASFPWVPCPRGDR